MKPVYSFRRHLAGTQANTNKEWEVDWRLWALRPHDWMGEADCKSSSDTQGSQGGVYHVASCRSSLHRES